MRQRTVMVVDDDQSIREFVEWALTAEGYAVVGAVNGAQALDLARRHHPDLILLDLRMPGMDGPAFARAYRGTCDAHAPIVVTSAARDGRGLTLEIGAADCLDKPFDLMDLLAVVERHTASRASRL